MQASPRIFSGRARRAACASLCCALLVGCAVYAGGAALAQSGRRQPRPVEIAPVPTPTPEPTPIPRPEVEPIGLVLLSDDSHSFDSPGSYSYVMREVVGQRLREAKAFDITGDSKTANRSEAHKRAKQETKRFVVWFRLDVPGAMGIPDIAGRSARDAQVEFVILEPATGKQQSSGRVFLGTTRRGTLGGIGRVTCYPSSNVRDYELIEASVEAADRVIRHFNVSLPPRCG